MSNEGARTILNEFGEDETLGPTSYTWEDFRLLLPVGIIALLILSKTPSEMWLLGAILSGGLIVFALMIIYLAPPYRPAHKWIIDRFQHIQRPDTMRPHDPTTNDDARTLTGVDRFLQGTDLHGNYGAVKRTDGGLVAAIEITAPPMELADRGRWRAAAESFEQFVNSLSFPIQIYSTARDVEVEKLTQKYRDRLAEPDQKVKENDQLQDLLETYRDQLPLEFEQRGTRVREFYILVPVSEIEIHLQNQDSMSQFSELPYFGELFRSVSTQSSDLSPQEVEYQQKRELNARLTALDAVIQEHLTNCSAEGVDVGELCDLLEEYWTGTRIDYPSTDDRIHTIPIVTPPMSGEGVSN